MPFRRKDPVATALIASGVPASEAARLAVAGTPIRVPAGTALCVEGDFGQEAFVLVHGEAVVQTQGENIRTVEAGEVFGEIAALNPHARRNATVETTVDSTVLVYDLRTFRSLAVDMGDLLAPERAA